MDGKNSAAFTDSLEFPTTSSELCDFKAVELLFGVCVEFDLVLVGLLQSKENKQKAKGE